MFFGGGKTSSRHTHLTALGGLGVTDGFIDADSPDAFSISSWASSPTVFMALSFQALLVCPSSRLDAAKSNSCTSFWLPSAVVATFS